MGLFDTTAGVITVTGEYHLRHLLEEPKAVILAILILGDGLAGSTTVHFSCLGILFRVRGCVASDDLKKDNNQLWLAGAAELVELFLVDFLPKEGSLGDQTFTSIDADNSLSMENCILLVSQDAAEFESGSQEGSGVVEKCKKEGAACTFLIDLTGTQ